MQEKIGFSIIIPTYKEYNNIQALVETLATTNFQPYVFEVILVDDNSKDGSFELVNELRQRYPWLRMLQRMQKRDLSRSVLDGIHAATYPICVTMDADLSHPADKILKMLEALMEPGVEVVFGSRYLPGGSVDCTWSFSRKFISRGSALLAKTLLPFPMTDPLSGFMAIRKETIFSGAPLTPIGWKIGLEILIKCHCRCVKEVPIHFSNRHLGYSKLTFKIGCEYLRHLLALTYYKLAKLILD